MIRTRTGQEVLFWVSRIVILFFIPIVISDVVLYFDFAKDFFQSGLWPYRNYDFEYPPLAFLLLAWPYAAQSFFHNFSLELYRQLFALPLLLFDAWIFYHHLNRPAVRYAALQYLFASTSMAFLLFDRFDILVGALIALPFLTNRFHSALWSFGSSLKILPVVIGFFSFLVSARRVFFFVGLALVVSMGVALALSKKNISFLQYHAVRGVQIESTMGNAALVWQKVLSAPVFSVGHEFRSHQISDVGLSKVAKALFIFGNVLLAVFLSVSLLRRKYDVASASWIFLLGFMVTGYVFSPQFILWVTPMAPIVFAKIPSKRKSIFFTIWALVVLLTSWNFYHYWSYVEQQPTFLLLVAIRNFLVFALVLVSIFWLYGFQQRKRL